AGPRHRIGESHGPAGEELLDGLGLWERFLAGPHRPAAAFFSAWGAPILLHRPAHRGWVLDRPAFDAMVHDAAASAVTHRLEGSVRKVRRDDGGWRVDLADGVTLHCRFLLDCTGCAAAIGRQLAGQRRVDRLMACHAEMASSDVGIVPTPATVLESARDGWWYATLLPSGNAIVAWFTDPGSVPILRDPDAWAALQAESRFAIPWLASAGFMVPALPVAASVGTVLLDRVSDAKTGWAAAGDAAAAFDPLSSHGLVSALWMGGQAGRAAAAWLRGDPAPLDAYAQTVARGTARYLVERQAMYARERRFAGAPFWRRRLASPLADFETNEA
ncbi:MAG: tryptophan 7-halogenase, partial [Thermomicrobiales bacterium]